ncbi:MAG: tetratricopeptide repeat protein [Sphingobacteriaceae bacterium]
MKKLPQLFYTLFLLIGTLSIGACNSQKENLSSREMQNLTAKFNILYNARTLVKESEQRIQEAYLTTYDQPISVFCEPNEKLGQAETTNLDKAILKANIVANEKSQSHFVDDAYLLIGVANYLKADFYNSVEFFSYVYNNYPEEKDNRQAALIWRGRAFMQLNRLPEAEASLDTALKYLKKSKKMVAEAYASKAQWYIRTKAYEPAIPLLNKAIKTCKSKAQRIRWTFLLAQLELETGKNTLAGTHFEQVFKSNAPFDMAFNAHLNQLSIVEQNSGKKIDRIKALKALLKDDKNSDNLDQIYFQIGRSYQQAGDSKQALANYEHSVRKNTRNQTQKGLSYLALANLYFNQADYVAAKSYYDSTLSVLPTDHPSFESIRKKNTNLDLLTSNLIIIATEDSLQALARLPAAAQRQKIVAQLEQKAKKDAAKKQTAGIQNTGTYIPTNDNTNSNIDTKFYFNNSAALSQGFADFKKRWGSRPLADDWRRSQTAGMATIPNNSTNPSTAASSSNLEAANAAEAINDQVNAILFTLPNSPDKLAQSNLRIAKAYYEIGNYYREIAQDQMAAIRSFEELLLKFPTYENTVAVCYNLYRLYAELDAKKSDAYKVSILNNYPNSVYAKVILDPEFNQKQDEQAIALNRAYNQTFDEFARRSYTNALVCIQELNAQFGKNKFSPQLAYLKTIAEGHQEALAPFETSLKKIVSTYPEDKLITPLVKNHLDFIEKNRKALAAKLAVLTDKDLLVYALVEEAKPDTNVNKPTKTLETEAKSVFSLADSSHYYVVIDVANGGVNLSSSRFGVGQFNRANFAEGAIKHQLKQAGDEHQLIYIGEFYSKATAADYLENIKTLLPDIMKVPAQSYSIFLSTKANLDLLTSSELLNQYQKFYTDHYQ